MTTTEDSPVWSDLHMGSEVDLITRHEDDFQLCSDCHGTKKLSSPFAVPLLFRAERLYPEQLRGH